MYVMLKSAVYYFILLLMSTVHLSYAIFTVYLSCMEEYLYDPQKVG